jgi:hypothetical protein
MSKSTVIKESEWMNEISKLPKRMVHRSHFTEEMDKRILEAARQGVSWKAFFPLFKSWYGFGCRDTIVARYKTLVADKKT